MTAFEFGVRIRSINHLYPINPKDLGGTHSTLVFYPTIFLFIILSSLHSQEGWRQLTTDDSLSSNAINTIYQAKNGDIWIGTDEEINRYNGVFEESWALFFPVNTIFEPSTGQLFSREDRPDGPLGSGGFESPFF